MSRRPVAAAALATVLALAGCNTETADPEPVEPTIPIATSASSPQPEAIGPTPRTVFSIIRELGVRPGSLDEFMIRDLLVVAESIHVHLLAHGVVPGLDEAKRTKDYTLRGGSTVELAAGLGSRHRFCLRSHLRDQDPREWFYDTDRVLPRGESCA